jgi:nucleoporin NDC1
LIFAVTRGLLSLLNAIPFLSPILSPLTHHFLQGPWTILLPFLHIPLLFQSFFLSVMTLFALEFADMLFDTFVTQVSVDKVD